MAESSSPPTSHYFNLTYPLPYVAHVEINRPEKLNAFIEPMWLHLPRLFSHLSSSPSIRAIILSGAGPKAFTAGLDITAITSGPLSQSAAPPPSATPKPTTTHTIPPYSQPTGTPYTTQTPPPPPPTPTDPARLARSLLTHITTFQSSLTSLETCPKPIIAVLHGHCYGLGIDLSLCADLRICTPSAKFAVKEVDLGLAADVGTLSRLGKVTGNSSWVKDVCISAREFDAHEALQFGFVSRITSPAALPSASEDGEMQAKEKETAMSAALQWASTVASKSPIAVQGTKELLNWSRDHSVADGLRYTAVWNGAMLQTEDVGRAMRAGGVGKGKEKKKPRFEKL
ncbi:MAG: hypothetical protein LQ339_002938 [Xanthoria mediterranea]|nr:MAG: hypothetical protein LQ339_002938 [Xanthoria mediterranea]